MSKRMKDKFKIQSDDVTLERLTTISAAVHLAKETSIFTDCDITVDQLQPITIDAILFADKTMGWLPVGYASNGVFYYAK